MTHAVDSPKLCNLITIRVLGDPKAQPRGRSSSFIGRDGKPKSLIYDPGTADSWKELVAWAAKKHRPARPIAGPVRIDITFLFRRPKSKSRKCDPGGRIPHIAKPDRDNLDKAVLDTLTQLNFLEDDKLVYTGMISKFYTAKQGDDPGALINIYHTDQAE